MRFSIVLCALAGLALAACESSPEVTSGSSGDGSARPATSQQGGAGGAGVSSQRLGAGAPGSAEDFVVNVGDRVLFAVDKYDLSPEARATIENQVTWLKRYPSATVTVEGHADERGTREYNLALGERRANSVRDYMIALGVPAARIKTVSYGKERPVDPASNEEAWARNRRSVTVVDGVSG